MATRYAGKKIKGLESQMALETRSVGVGEVSAGGNPSLLDGLVLDSKGGSGGSYETLFLFFVLWERSGFCLSLGEVGKNNKS